MQRRSPQNKVEPVDQRNSHRLSNSKGNNGQLRESRDGNPFASQPLLRAVAIYSGAARLAEMAALMGFDAIWIEMEHGPADFNQVESLCVSIERGGALPIVRVPDLQRHHILRSLEVGGRVIVVPMINTAGQARQLVEHGKFPPIGSRGYNVRSRGVGYGLGSKADLFQAANSHTYLFAQIETTLAVENVDAICQVEGLSGIFIGPGDLSVSAGCMGELQNDRLIDMVTHCIRQAKDHGKYSGILVPPGRMLDAAIETGCNLVVCGGDVTELQASWAQLLARLTSRKSVDLPVESPELSLPAWALGGSRVSQAVAAAQPKVKST
ncbi:MAG TPA: aldolase/citrate lyase family protein [Tepidisphaeraceae bacterium]|nr:aldolase/citrate lyase family protein [Tepidisphaeraceae bacterium]